LEKKRKVQATNRGQALKTKSPRDCIELGVVIGGGGKSEKEALHGGRGRKEKNVRKGKKKNLKIRDLKEKRREGSWGRLPEKRSGAPPRM